jgi:purine-binding chemotaxis protein CheW
VDGEIHELKIVCFRLGGETFAVDIMRVREIIKPQKLSRLPEAPVFLEGVINLRGAIIPVLDLRKRFGMRDPLNPVDQRLLIAMIGRRPVGLAVDSVTEVVTIAVNDIRPPPEIVRFGGRRYLLGVCLVRQRFVMLVNPDSLLDSCETDGLVEFMRGEPQI